MQFKEQGDQVMWCQIHCLHASQCNLEYPRLPKHSFRLQKLPPEDPHQPHKRSHSFTLKLQVKAGGRGFYYEAWTSCKHATKAGKKPSTPALKKGKGHRLHYTSGPPTRMYRVHW